MAKDVEARPIALSVGKRIAAVIQLMTSLILILNVYYTSHILFVQVALQKWPIAQLFAQLRAHGLDEI